MTGPNMSFAVSITEIKGNYGMTKDSKNQAKEAGSDTPFAQLIGQSMGMVSNDKNRDVTVKDTTSDLFGMAASVDAKGNQTKAKLSTSTVSDSNSTKEIDEETVAKVSDAVQDISEEVAKEISEELDVTDEQIEAAMENLGLSYMDLINPQNMEALIGELQNLYSEGNPTLASVEPATLVMEMIPKVDEIIGESLDENGISLEEFGDFFKAVSNEEIDIPEDIKDLLPKTSEFNQTIQRDVSDTEALVKGNTSFEAVRPENDTASLKGTTETTVQVIKLTDEDLIDENGNVSEEAVLDGEVREDPTLNLSSDNSGEGSSNSNNQSQSQNETGQNTFDFFKSSVAGDTITSENVVTSATNAQVQTFEQVAAQVEQVTSYTTEQTNDIINQIVTRASTTITDNVSRMEMELNPQNLGRMIMQVQEQEGAYTAKLIAQNANVKEALETQLALLKSSLEARGIKVDSVEVAVGTHEFEQALEEGMGQTFEGQSENEEQSQNSRIRNLNREELDSISDDLTEEEALAAAIMRDNGGTVDYSA